MRPEEQRPASLGGRRMKESWLAQNPNGVEELSFLFSEGRTVRRATRWGRPFESTTCCISVCRAGACTRPRDTAMPLAPGRAFLSYRMR